MLFCVVVWRNWNHTYLMIWSFMYSTPLIRVSTQAERKKNVSSIEKKGTINCDWIRYYYNFYGFDFDFVLTNIVFYRLKRPSPCPWPTNVTFWFHELLILLYFFFLSRQFAFKAHKSFWSGQNFSFFFFWKIDNNNKIITHR